MSTHLPKVDHTQFDREKWKVWHKNHPLIIHWRLNPGLAFNELILGQRNPEVMLIDKHSDKAECDSTFVPCPHCGELNSSKLYAHDNAFKNWAGLYCGSCDKQIPTVLNLFSFLALIITFPLFICFTMFYKEKVKTASIKRTKKLREQYTNNTLPTAEDTSFTKLGFQFGLYFFGAMCVSSLFLSDSMTDFELRDMGVLAICSCFAGLLFGVLMKFMVGRKPKRT
ncbi:hypothetical protein ISG33_12620 [Glaciecola sp. MH2013]|uniref:hypothetical protein n=1 Tax=Glaciecola sp. MH2013 TaxID=2785524 RepID=UPI00189D84D4|nr:hypothetical protein [Glaciecola sp. MH2013]MBF7074242.1 hypothetical protein [Glaciecola sp. MH2013]